LKQLNSTKEQNTRKLTAKEILEKHHLDETILTGIEADLSEALSKWHSRHGRRRKKSIVQKMANPNTSISFQVRSLIAYFSHAILRLKDLEEQQKLNIKTSDVREKDKVIRKLRKSISSLEAQVSELASQKSQFEQEIESLRTAQEKNKIEELTAMENLDKECEYLEIFTSHTLRGEMMEFVEIDSISGNHSDQEEDEEAQAAMEMMFGRDQDLVSENGWRSALKPGDMVDCLDRWDLWFTATIMDVKSMEDGDQLLIHYQGFDNKYDEWILRFDPRIAQEGQWATGGKESGGTLAFRYQVIGTRDGKNVVKEGYMMLKSSGRLRSTFKSRHFVLFEEGILKYYTNKKAQEALGAINLCLVKWIQVERALNRKKLFEFSLQETHRQWLFKVVSHENMNNWIQVLKKIRLRSIDAYNLNFFIEQPQSTMSFDSIYPVQRSRQYLLQDRNSETPTGLFEMQQKVPLPLHQGVLWKLGRTVRNWKKRFCILYDSRIISYFESEVDPLKPSYKPKGEIDLWGVIAIRQMTEKEAEMVKLPKDCKAGLILHTSERQWLLGMKSKEDLEKWKVMIMENAIFDGTARVSDADSLSSQHSRRWSIANLIGDVVSKRSGYSKGLQKFHQSTESVKPERYSSVPRSSPLNSRCKENQVNTMSSIYPITRSPSVISSLNTPRLTAASSLSLTTQDSYRDLKYVNGRPGAAIL